MGSPRSFPRLAAALALVLAVAGCAADPPKPPSGAPPGGEGVLNLVGLPGLVETGAADQSVDWVAPFRDRTGCEVSVRMAADGADAYRLMSGGGFDAALVPAEFTRRLYDEGGLAAIGSPPPAFAGLDRSLRDQVTADGRVFAVPFTWSADVLAYDPRRVRPAPVSWGAVFDPARTDRRTLWADGPLTLATAALYLRANRPELGVTDPFRLTPEQLAAVTALLRDRRPEVAEPWDDPATAVELLTSGEVPLGQATAYEVRALRKAGRDIAAARPKEGTIARLTSWTVSAKAAHPSCAAQWLDWTLTPDVQMRTASWRGVAPANPKACELLPSGFCAAYRVRDARYLSGLTWVTPPRDWDAWVEAWRTVVPPDEPGQ